MERYFAREENGKGYLYDREFSEKVPIAVDHTYQQAEASAARFNNNTKPKKRLKEYIIYYYEQDGTPVCLCAHYAKDHFVCGRYLASDVYTTEERRKNSLEEFGYVIPHLKGKDYQKE